MINIEVINKITLPRSSVRLIKRDKYYIEVYARRRLITASSHVDEDSALKLFNMIKQELEDDIVHLLYKYKGGLIK